MIQYNHNGLRDMKAIKNNSLMFDYDDKEAELISLNWVLFKDNASSIEYKINELYTNNVKQIKTIPNGK